MKDFDKNCEFKSKEKMLKFHKCKNEDKQPGFYLCVQARTCPKLKEDK